MKEFNKGETIVVLYAYHDCETEDGDGRYAVDPFDTTTISGECLDDGSENDDGVWGAMVRLENGDELWLQENFVITERDLAARFTRS